MRARQPFFGEISSRFEFGKAKSGLFLKELRFFDIIILKASDDLMISKF